MADAVAIRDELLKKHGTLIRTRGPHPVWKLENGEMVTVSSTGNPDSVWTEVRKIRHKLGLVEAQNKNKEKEKIVIAAMEEKPRINGSPQQPPELEMKSPAPALEDSSSTPEFRGPTVEVDDKVKSPMFTRVSAHVVRLDAEKKQLTESLERVELEIQRMTKALVLLEDPEMEEIWAMLLEARPGAVPAKTRAKRVKHGDEAQAPPVVPPHVGTSVKITAPTQVTRDLVLAATQAFPNTFRFSDLMELMVGGPTALNPSVRGKVIQSIRDQLYALKKAGKVVQTVRGVGRAPAVFKKVDLTRLGIR